MDRQFNRRRFLIAASTALGAAAISRITHAETREVPWLDNVQHAPSALTAESRELPPLLLDDDGSSIATRTQWEARRTQLRKRWLDFLGPMPEPPPPTFTVIAQDRPNGCRRLLVRYESEPGVPVDGYILYPDPLGNAPRPGVVALHSTTPDTIHEIAGVTGRDSRALGLQLARDGFAVFCPQCFLWRENVDYAEAARRFMDSHPGTLGMRKMLYDAQRAVDILAAAPEVDPTRIGAAGHSLGAKETLYLAAFDDRIRAAVASEGGIGLDFTNWHDSWYLGPAIHEPAFPRNHHELLALIAPRAFLILAGESGPPNTSVADGDRTWPYVEAALPVYRLYGEPARIGLYNHRQGHTIPDDAYARLREWLEVYLA